MYTAAAASPYAIIPLGALFPSTSTADSAPPTGAPPPSLPLQPISSLPPSDNNGNDTQDGSGLAYISVSRGQAQLYVSVFEDVVNAKESKQFIVSGSGVVPNCVLLNGAAILDKTLLQLSALKALLAQSSSSMRTRTLYSEVIFNLSPTNNISDALRSFGISDTAPTSLIAVTIGDAGVPGVDEEQAEVHRKLEELIKGRRTGIERIGQLVDLDVVTKIYKTGANGSNGNVKGKKGSALAAPPSHADDLLAIVIGTMALKGYTN
ncbi:kinase binding protein CGI-121-domain-containing protein [Fimicolochytrium jonesii]|uniref:kinase binding protein CGI-121-domain-containing protein n=1 Tax=Fimicolochytrium jonesii TaxID=1396493 RepID=UPI0022FF08D2|nr:kinase binding protein CGI-121-domain-containing protein [Fimicolochytrium jonesii]KAI8816450.1 kinase binding protein CGI-121-domain-containing protein [Fimicolochytrium jonesii]